MIREYFGIGFLFKNRMKKFIVCFALLCIIAPIFVARIVCFLHRLHNARMVDNQIRRMYLVNYNLGELLTPIHYADDIKKICEDKTIWWPWIFVREGVFDENQLFSIEVPSSNSWRSNTSLHMYPNSFPDTNLNSYEEFESTVYNKKLEWNKKPNITSHYACYCWTEDPNSPEYSMTNGMTLVGKDTITDALRSKTFPTDVKEIDKILDLIVYVEVNHSGVHWMQSGDLDIENVPEDFTKGMTGLGVAVMFLDGDIWFIDRKCPLENIKTFMTLTGARENERDALLKPYCLRTWADVFR